MNKYKHLRDEKNMATTRNILHQWNKGGISSVDKFLLDEDVKIYKETWGEKIKNLLKDKLYKSAEEEIRHVYSSINRNNKNT